MCVCVSSVVCFVFRPNQERIQQLHAACMTPLNMIACMRRMEEGGVLHFVNSMNGELAEPPTHRPNEASLVLACGERGITSHTSGDQRIKLFHAVRNVRENVGHGNFGSPKAEMTSSFWQRVFFCRGCASVAPLLFVLFFFSLSSVLLGYIVA